MFIRNKKYKKFLQFHIFQTNFFVEKCSKHIAKTIYKQSLNYTCLPEIETILSNSQRQFEIN